MKKKDAETVRKITDLLTPKHVNNPAEKLIFDEALECIFADDGRDDESTAQRLRGTLSRIGRPYSSITPLMVADIILAWATAFPSAIGGLMGAVFAKRTGRDRVDFEEGYVLGAFEAVVLPQNTETSEDAFFLLLTNALLEGWYLECRLTPMVGGRLSSALAAFVHELWSDHRRARRARIAKMFDSHHGSFIDFMPRGLPLAILDGKLHYELGRELLSKLFLTAPMNVKQIIMSEGIQGRNDIITAEHLFKLKA